ncbi:MAG: galactose oxidase, partial [Dehalococcoidia bacterium]
MNKTIQVLVVVLVVSISPFLVPRVRAAEDFWTTKAPMTTARSGLGVAVVNGKIYAIGGSDGNRQLDTNQMYDPATNTWVNKQPMPTARSRFGITVYQNKIYVIGGTTPSGLTDANEVYDPLTDTWETKTPMPTGDRDELAASVVNGKIYLIGGSFHHLWPIPSNLTEVYDPETDTWTTKASMPTAVYSCTSAVVDNKIYLIENGR